MAFAQGESRLPKQWSERALKYFTGYNPGKFIIILDHTALYRAAPSNQISAQEATTSKRDSLVQYPSLFSRCCFHHTAFWLHCKFEYTQETFAFFLHPKIEEKLTYMKMKWELRPWRKMAQGVENHARLFPGNGQKVHHMSHCNLRWLNSWRINCQEYDTAQDSSRGRRNLLK